MWGKKELLKVNVLLRQENKTKKKEQGNSKSQKGWAVKEWFLFFGELKVLTGHRRTLYGHYPCSNHWSFFGFMFRPSLDRVFAKEGELRGFLNLLFRFFSAGGWGSKSSHINIFEKLSVDENKVVPSFSGSLSFLLRWRFLTTHSGCCWGSFGFCSFLSFSVKITLYILIVNCCYCISVLVVVFLGCCLKTRSSPRVKSVEKKKVGKKR